MRIYAGDLSFPDFRWLIEHAHWQALPVPPGEDLQGLDVRQWIGKHGVVFSAYRIPRGSRSEVFGTVDLKPVPSWAMSTGLRCTISVEELVAKLGLSVGPEGAFRLLNFHLDEVRSYLEGKQFACAVLHSHIAYLHSQYESDRSTLRELRPEIGTFRLIRGLLLSSASERRHLARYRRALSSLDEPSHALSN